MGVICIRSKGKEFPRKHAFPFSEAFLLISRTDSVPWVKK